jgi:inner membrane protein
MLIRTHLSITLLFILLFISSIEYKLAFVLAALIATFIPDIDSQFSIFGKKKTFRILQFFVKHRGVLHSFSFLFIISLFLVLFFPKISLGFFLGYGLHLLADSFTVIGIKPFYPYKKKSSGRIKTGGKSEISIFVFFVLANLGLFFLRILSIS